jgi:hypothetical protein
MTKQWWCLVLVATLGLGGAGLWLHSAAAQAPADQDQISQLIKQLDSPKYAEREKAKRDLEKLGVAALEQLRKAAKDGDLEIALRCKELVSKLESKINAENMLAPRKVHLKLKDTPVLQAIDELQKQSGYPILVQGDRTTLVNRKVTLDTGEVPFLQAFDLLCEKANLTEVRSSGPNYVSPYDPTMPVIRQPIKIQPLPPQQVPQVPVPAPQIQIQRGQAVPVAGPQAMLPGQAQPAVEIKLQVDLELPAVGGNGRAVNGAAKVMVPVQVGVAEAKPGLAGQPGQGGAGGGAGQPGQPGQGGAGGGGQPGQGGQGGAGGGAGQPGQPGQPGQGGAGGAGGGAGQPGQGGAGGGAGQPGQPGGVVQGQPAQIQIQIQPGGQVQIQPGPGMPAQPQPYPVNNYPPGQFVVRDGTPAKVPTFYHGALRIRLLTFTQAPPGVAPRQEGEALFLLEVTPEPRLLGFDIVGSPRVEKAVDDLGQEVILAMEPMGQPGHFVNTYYNPQSPGTVRQAVLRLKLGSKQAKTLTTLQGNLTVQALSVKADPVIAVDDVMNATGKTSKGKSGGAIEVLSIQKQDNGTYRTVIRFEQPPQFVPVQGPAVVLPGGPAPLPPAKVGAVNQVQGPVATTKPVKVNTNGLPVLVDANGKALELAQVPTRVGRSVNGKYVQEITMIFQAGAVGEPARMVLLGHHQVTTQVPFVFQGVKLD